MAPSPCKPGPPDYTHIKPDQFEPLREQIFEDGDSRRRFPWIRDVLQDPKLRRYYRIFEEDIDGDILKVATDIAKPGFTEQNFTKEAINFYLRQMWRLLMRDYAFWHAICVDKILCVRRRDWAWLPWRIVSAYCIPRLGAALAIGWVSVNNFTDLLTAATQISQKGPAAVFSTVSILLLGSLFVGALDVQRRIGRRFAAIVRRSCILLVIGVLWTAAGMVVHAALCSLLKTHYFLKPRLIAAALSLFLAHVMQLFWHEYSTAEPL
jgi:hypothetical protein